MTVIEYCIHNRPFALVARTVMQNYKNPSVKLHSNAIYFFNLILTDSFYRTFCAFDMRAMPVENMMSSSPLMILHKMIYQFSKENAKNLDIIHT